MGKQFIRICKHIGTGKLSDVKVDENYKTTNLVYDIKTKIIFYKFSEITTVTSMNFEEQEPYDTKVGFMCPYISEKGKYCRFEDDKIVEIA